MAGFWIASMDWFLRAFLQLCSRLSSDRALIGGKETRVSTVQKIQAAAARRKIAILGSTGSVGQQTIDLISRAPGAYETVALTANKNVALLAEQARALQPKMAVVADESQYQALKEALAGTGIQAA